MTGIEGIIESAVATVKEASTQQTGGKWLENITILIAPLIGEWDIERCYLWAEWPEREARFPNTTNQDVGIDAVAIRRSDGQHIAIQCKSRQLDEHGRGDPINKGELDKFISSSADALWAERWLVVIGDTRLGGNEAKAVGRKPVTLVNIETDLRKQQDADRADPTEPCPHCDGSGDRRTRDCMQGDAIETSVKILRQHACCCSDCFELRREICTGLFRSRIVVVTD